MSLLNDFAVKFAEDPICATTADKTNAFTV
jgi:hypothetical protein